jgi:hypothetical protein
VATKFPSQIPKWLRFTAFQETHRFSAVPWLVAVSHYLDLRPTYWRQKYALQRRIRGTGLPLIGHVHLPKTGGSYTNSVANFLPHLNLGHTLIREDRGDRYCPTGLMPIDEAKVKGFFLFSNVRNPLRFLVSYFHHAGGEWVDGPYPNPDFYDHPLARKGFETFARTILRRTAPWPSNKFLFPTLFNDHGRCVVDWINRNEELDADLTRLAECFGRSFQPQARRNVSNRAKPVEAYYSDALLAEVQFAYRREMALFGYRGFNVTRPHIPLHPAPKARLEYDYETDTLRLDGKVLDRSASAEGAETLNSFE